MTIVLSVLVGLGLAAACGFRVFLPLLIASLAVKAGWLTVTPGFAWMGSDEAMIAFAVASGLEILGYWIPWLDHALDVLAAPAAVVAGTLLAASQFGFTTSSGGQLLQWSLALVAGGGAAGVVQAGTSLVRAGSTAITGGLGNPLVSTVEAAAAGTITVMSIVAPIALWLGLCLMMVLAIRWWQRRQARYVQSGAVGSGATAA